MRNGPDESACDCPVECNTISYSFRVVITPFDQEELCPQRFAADASLVKPISYHRLPPYPCLLLESTSGLHDDPRSIGTMEQRSRRTTPLLIFLIFSTSCRKSQIVSCICKIFSVFPILATSGRSARSQG